MHKTSLVKIIEKSEELEDNELNDMDDYENWSNEEEIGKSSANVFALSLKEINKVQTTLDLSLNTRKINFNFIKRFTNKNAEIIDEEDGDEGGGLLKKFRTYQKNKGLSTMTNKGSKQSKTDFLLKSRAGSKKKNNSPTPKSQDGEFFKFANVVLDSLSPKSQDIFPNGTKMNNPFKETVHVENEEEKIEEQSLISPLARPDLSVIQRRESNEDETTHITRSESTTSRYCLPRRCQDAKNIFEEYLVIGIDSNGLDFITEETLLLTPKILFNYPDKLQENELKFNIRFLKNFCFSEGVKVERLVVTNQYEFEFLLQKNLLSKILRSFCLVQQITPDDIQKYFIFGVTFNDFYITPHRFENNLKLVDEKGVCMFIYEKTYLFISFEPICDLFSELLETIINIKKLNFQQHYSEISKFLDLENEKIFSVQNDERYSSKIGEILEFFFNTPYPRNDESICFTPQIGELSLRYKYPSKDMEKFLATKWLARKFFRLMDLDIFYEVLIRVLAEQSFIFMCDNIEHLTTLVLGFSYLIQPFKWNFILIPNLPYELLNIVESPVPYLIGILGGDKLKHKFLFNSEVRSNIFHLKSERNIEICYQDKKTFRDPALKEMKKHLNQNFNMMNYFEKEKLTEEYGDSCDKIYHCVYNSLFTEVYHRLFHTLEALKLTGTNLDLYEPSEETRNLYRKIRREFVDSLHEDDKSFGESFIHTQFFQLSLEKIISNSN